MLLLLISSPFRLALKYWRIEFWSVRHVHVHVCIYFINLSKVQHCHFKHQKTISNTIVPKIVWMIVNLKWVVRRYHYVHYLWQNVAGGRISIMFIFGKLHVSRKREHFRANNLQGINSSCRAFYWKTHEEIFFSTYIQAYQYTRAWIF